MQLFMALVAVIFGIDSTGPHILVVKEFRGRINDELFAV